MNHIVNRKADEEYCVFDCSDYSGTWMTASSTSGQEDYQLCPYSRPPDPSLSWNPENKGSFTTTAEDGIVYSCGDSGYLDNNAGNAKSCVTSMESITQITSIYTAYTASLESEASESRSSVSASKASASSASAASAASASAASAAAATPSSFVFISEISNIGFDAASSGPPGYAVTSSEYYDPYICDLETIGSDNSFGNSPPDLDIDGGDFEDCKYDSDSDTIECDNFSLPCSSDDEYTGEPSTKNCDSTVVRVCHRDI